MSKTDQNSLPSGLAGGRLEGISVPELLWGLSRSGKTGVLRITHDEVTKLVYIEDGRIIFATSSDPDDRLGETLLREDLITLDQLQRAAARFGTGKRLGTILVEIAAITPQDLVNGVIAQVREIILGLFPLEDGDYRFDEGPLPTEELITVNTKMEELLLLGIRQVRSFSRIRASVGPPRTVYRLTRDAEKISEVLDLNEGETVLLRHLDAHGRTVDELCQKVFLSNFEIYQSLWAFKVLGLIQEVERAASSPEAAAIEGHLGPGGIGPVLVRLCRDGETGVLFASSNAVDRAFHLREGRLVFATSSNVDDGLVAHLLRRGVISLRDREETARRLLSNKRVGTILREMGVLDERDLAEMVREQIAEIVYDTFRWDRGEFAFVPGELPTIEEIVLESSVEDIVQRGIARVTSWSRVLHGCGGLENRMVLSSDYLDVLDRMTVGQEEWEVVAALRTPKTVAEVCRESSLGDFRVCQISWAFNVIGVAAAAATRPAEAETEAEAEVGHDEVVAIPEPAEAVMVAEVDEGSTEIAVEALDEDQPERDSGMDDNEPASFEAGPDRVEAAEALAAAPADAEASAGDDEPGTIPSRGEEIPEADADPEPADFEPEVDREPLSAGAVPVDGDRREPPVEEIDEPVAVFSDADATLPGWQRDQARAAEPAMAEESLEAEGMDSTSRWTEPTVADEGEVGGFSETEIPEADDAMESVEEPEPLPTTAEPEETAPAWDLQGLVVEAVVGPSVQDGVCPEPDETPSSNPEIDDDVAAAAESETPAADTTRYFPREDVEAMLETEARDSEPPPFSVTDATGAIAGSADDAAGPESAPVDEALGEPDPGVGTVRLSRQEVEAALAAEAARQQAEAEEPQDESVVSEPEPRSSFEEPDPLEDHEPAAYAAERDGGGNGHDDDWMPPEDLEPLISRFNAMQRIVYRSIRSEVGAGAANFVKSCGGSLDRFGTVFRDVDLQADGAWDPGGLREALVEGRVEDPWDGFQKLLDEEIDKLRVHIGDARAASLQERLSGVEN